MIEADYKRLYDSVKLMRELQKEYFRNRDSTILQKAKEVEREVDSIIKEKDNQLELF